jgi:hypothetical protein
MTHGDVIDRLGGIRAVAQAVGVHESRVGRWRRSGIPPVRWAAVTEFARVCGLRDVTLDALADAARVHAPSPPLRRGRKPRTSSEVAA